MDDEPREHMDPDDMGAGLEADLEGIDGLTDAEAEAEAEHQAALTSDPEGSDLPTEPITDNSDGLDAKLVEVASGVIALAEELPKVITPDPEAEVRMLREHDQHMRDLAEEHEELEREWETAKTQAKTAKDRMDECALRLRNAALERPTFGPLFDSAKQPSPVAPVASPVEPAEQPPVETPIPWRERPLLDNVPDVVAGACADLDLDTFGDVYATLELCDDADLIDDLMHNTEVTEEQARRLIDQVNEMAKADQPADDAPADPDYWKTVDIGELVIPGSLTVKLREQGITTLGELSEAVIKCGHEGYRGLKGVGEKKAEQIEDAWQQWFAEHPAPQVDPVEEPAEVAA